MIKKIIIVLLLFSFQIYSTSKNEIKTRIEDVLNQLPASCNPAVLVYNPLTKDTIFSLNKTLSVIPASNTKLFTTVVALSVMGSDYQLSTKLLTNDKNFKDGIINGNLYIKGYGNSLFTTKDLIELVDKIKSMGIKRITGNIIGDDYYFDELYTRKDWINDEETNVSLPPISALVLDRNRTFETKRIKFRKRRKVFYREVTVAKNISNPPLFIANVLRAKLISAGIRVDKAAIKGLTPNDAVTLADSYILLKDLIQTINKHSDNFLAECLFKTIGAVATGNQGNSFYSTQTIIKFLKANGIYTNGTSIVDGSGLSRYDLVTVSAIVGLLEKTYFDMGHFKDFYNSLSVAGIDGTLRHRMMGTAAENNFHGKTGTLNGVSSLSGYVSTKKGTDLIVSIIFDFQSHGANYYRGIENKIVEILSDWE
jgi:D-alanyl-D-alanine carboxypeptidase